MKKIIVLLIICIAYGTGIKAQSCKSNINYSCWWDANTIIPSLYWNKQGNKLITYNYGGSTVQFCGNTRNVMVLNADTGNISANLTMSFNQTGGGRTNFMPNGYIISGPSNSGGTYHNAAGTAGTLSGSSSGIYELAPSLDRDSAVYYGFSGMYVVNLHNATTPVFTAITPTLPSGYGIANSSYSSIATAGNRIYMGLSTSSNTSQAHGKITCVTYTGATCPNWTDITISLGTVNDMEIRPTDGKIFARTFYANVNNVGYVSPSEPGGLIIFDSTGALATGFNWADLNIVSHAVNGSSITPLVRFDAAGNIFCNTEATNGMGLYKFDPQGNIDISFMRNLSNSYMFPGMTNYQVFDVNPVNGMIAASLVNRGSGGKYHAITGGNHQTINNENWWLSFMDNGSGSGGAPASYNGGTTDGYESMHLIYNNGKLKVQGESTNDQTDNCGAQTPVVVANNPKAAGTINCAGLAFMAAPTQGTASTLVLKVPVNVTTAGDFRPITVSGSGMTLQDPNDFFTTTQTGNVDFYLPLKYNGTTALGSFTITVAGAGTCTVNLADTTKNNPSVINIWTPENCTYKAVGPDLK